MAEVAEGEWECVSGAVSVATELGCEISAFEVLPNLIYPYMLLICSLVFIFVLPER